MTPHGVLQDIRTLSDVLPRALGMFDTEALIDAAKTIAKSVHFEFGNVAPLTEHQAFANECLERGVFRLPYNTVFLTGAAIPKTGIVATQHIEDGKLTRLSWYTVAPVMIGGDAMLSAPLMCGEMVCPSLATATVNWRSLTTQKHGSRTTGRVWSEEDYEAAADKALLFILSMTVLLMSKDVEVDVETPSERLNRRRAQQGRFQIQERRTVRIKIERRRAYATALHDFRASPRMHWRRGHFRKLPSGSVVPVAPTIVNASPDSKPTAKTYEVT